MGSASKVYRSFFPSILYQQKRKEEDSTDGNKSNKLAVPDKPLHVHISPHIVPNTNITISKTVFSSKLRLIFLVGLEGTGHHYMADVLDRLCSTAMVHCPQVCRMAEALYPGLGKPESANSYLEARQQLRREMEELEKWANDLAVGKATMVGFGKCRNSRVGMMSYPNFNGDTKAIQYVDFRILVEEAERAGVDLRIIYLSRSARDIVISDTKHHNYGDTWVPLMGCVFAV